MVLRWALGDFGGLGGLFTFMGQLGKLLHHGTFGLSRFGAKGQKKTFYFFVLFCFVLFCFVLFPIGKLTRNCLGSHRDGSRIKYSNKLN